MTRRERLIATLRGAPVDRPAVSFYEIGGFKVNPSDPDPFNIYNAPSWQPLLQLAEEKTDLIRMIGPTVQPARPDVVAEFIDTTVSIRDGSRFERTVVRVGGRTLTSLTRRDPDLDTVWQIEHLLKDEEDLQAYLKLPAEVFDSMVDIAPLVAEDRALGDRGIVMVDTPDPLCLAAGLFAMEEYTVIAMTNPELFHKLLEKLAPALHARTEQVAREFPGHLWRIYGPEYAAAPYLPPELFAEYVVRYTGPMVESIRRHGGYARIHSHGRLRDVLPMIVGMGVSALDPVEPPPQGDVTLAEVRRQYGRELVLFGNLEITDIENLPPAAFEKVVARALQEGTEGPGRGLVLMPSAAPYGRVITPTTMANYETMVRLIGG